MIFFLGILVCLFFCCYQLYKRISYTIKNSRLASQKKPFTPDNTLIVFDLHGVVFNHDYKQMVLTFLRSPLKKYVLLQLLHPCIFRDIFKVVHRNVPEAFFVHMAYHYASPVNVIPLLIEIGNSQKICQPVIEIIKQLKQQGYQLAVLSNIGHHMYLDLKKKHPDIFALFDNIMVAMPDTGYLSKPNPGIYEYFIKMYNQDKRNMILIDDKVKNLIPAIPFGITGIPFSSPEQLKKKLNSLGILFNA